MVGCMGTGSSYQMMFDATLTLKWALSRYIYIYWPPFHSTQILVLFKSDSTQYWPIYKNWSRLQSYWMVKMADRCYCLGFSPGFKLVVPLKFSLRLIARQPFIFLSWMCIVEGGRGGWRNKALAFSATLTFSQRQQKKLLLRMPALINLLASSNTQQHKLIKIWAQNTFQNGVDKYAFA